jgi:hypothetical protein
MNGWLILRQASAAQQSLAKTTLKLVLTTTGSNPVFTPCDEPPQRRNILH